MPAVSFSGDQAIIDALSVIARRRKSKIGKLVADAVQEVYGSEIAEVRSSFFADGRTSENNTTASVQARKADKKSA